MRVLNICTNFSKLINILRDFTELISSPIRNRQYFRTTKLQEMAIIYLCDYVFSENFVKFRNVGDKLEHVPNALSKIACFR